MTKLKLGTPISRPLFRYKHSFSKDGARPSITTWTLTTTTTTHCTLRHSRAKQKEVR